MNDKEQSSFTSREIPVSRSSTSSTESRRTTGCFKLLSNFFKVKRKETSVSDIADNDAREFDYVVEKLVVQRVPCILVSVQGKTVASKDNHNRETDKRVHADTDPSDSSKEAYNCQKSLRKVNNLYSGSETQSLIYNSDRLNRNMIPPNISNKCLLSDTKRALLSERNKKCTLNDSYHYRITELMDTMCSLHPDLKDHERPPKDPYPLNMKKKHSSSLEISIKKLLNTSNENGESKSFKSQLSLDEPFFGEKEYVLVNSYGSKSRNEENVFHVNETQNMAGDNFQSNYASKYEETTNQPVEDISCVENNVENCNERYSELECNNFNFMDESKKLSEISANSSSSNATLRWKIVVKHCETET